MLIRECTPEDLTKAEESSKRFVALKKSGICATCYHKEHGDIFQEIDGTAIYEDEIFEAFFATNPRREGHVIVSTKKHYEDISEMPSELSGHIMNLMLVIIHAQKQILKAKKVYMVTMCDERKTHLHFQLIPNYEGMKHGKHVFVAERKMFNYDKIMVDRIKELVENGYVPNYTVEYVNRFGMSKE